jgi:hypothetical protein
MFKINWDAIGITTSLACAIHCALLPLFLTSLPLFGINIIHNLPFEYGMIIIAFLVGTYSLYHGQKKHHHRWLPFQLFFLGILLLLAKVTWHQWELWLLLPAVSCIISAHVLNYRFCRIPQHGHSDDCNH